MIAVRMLNPIEYMRTLNKYNNYYSVCTVITTERDYPLKEKSDPTIADIPLHAAKGRGRKKLYDFWDIPVDPNKCRIFTGTDVHRLNAAVYQFCKSYGGDFTMRTLDDGSVAVWCLEAPKKK